MWRLVFQGIVNWARNYRDRLFYPEVRQGIISRRRPSFIRYERQERGRSVKGILLAVLLLLLGGAFVSLMWILQRGFAKLNALVLKGEAYHKAMAGKAVSYHHVPR